MDEKHRLLKKYWGYDNFRPLQEEIIESVLQGHDTLALLPTGGGKSLCYQLPALMRDGLCLVVSPLIALMKDQVQTLNDRHLKAACIVTGMSASEVTGVLNNAICGNLKFLYISPERLQQRRFIEHFRQMEVGLIAVDEAHCISQWGYDFRPPYLEIASVRTYHPATPLLALTATATVAVADDICQRLAMTRCQRFRASFVRPNLAYMVLHEADKSQRLLRIVNRVGGTGIVYVRSRSATQSLARFLTASGVSATYYHAGLSARDRDKSQALWMDGRYQVMVATNAFGMGIDKPDVRFVIHMDIPESLEAYFQEAGRAGRDGKKSYAVLLCAPSDIERLQRDFATDYPTLRQLRAVYAGLCNFYRLPQGAGADSQFPLDIESVCNTYNFSPRMFYSACRILEREGLIAIPDHEDVASTVFIPVARDELYRFKVDHQRLGDLLQTMMRMYPGLLETSVAIDERKIAERCFSTAVEVAGLLSQLHDMHIIRYKPKVNGPQVHFLSERIDERLICPSKENYALMKEAASARIEAICRYVADDSLCRSRHLVAYFGDTASSDCGMCDVCLHKAPTDKGAIRSAVETLLRSNAIDVRQVVQMLSADGAAEIPDIIREMLDAGEVTLDDSNRLHLVE
ncbi:MAG: RecQ family ATP-dependent DNA helicase [Bacteroidales bacterium]|nr:RecQ family ATP-dependent DNA helicase [Bacteroidales bacterium]